jgi:hypothetical protein
MKNRREWVVGLWSWNKKGWLETRRWNSSGRGWFGKNMAVAMRRRPGRKTLLVAKTQKFARKRRVQRRGRTTD